MLKYADNIISATEKFVEYKIYTYNKVNKSIRRKSGSVSRSVQLGRHSKTARQKFVFGSKLRTA